MYIVLHKGAHLTFCEAKSFASPPACSKLITYVALGSSLGYCMECTGEGVWLCSILPLEGFTKLCGDV